jgi:aspartyl-tRNA(Asn)/glutamyl-tRNA(Gln) amidotransferase subunit A
METIAGPDPEDPTAAHVDVPGYRKGLRTDLKGLTIGIASGPEFEDVDPEISGLLDVALGVLDSLGAQTVPIPVPDVSLLNDLQQVLVKCEAATLLGPLIRTRGDLISLPAMSVIQEGLLIPATRYLEAKSMREPLLRIHVEAVFGKVHALFAPVVRGPAPTISSTLSEDSAAVERLFTSSARYTRFANYLGTPGLSVPCGFTVSGLPTAFQLLGRPFSEQVLLAVAHAYQTATDHHRRAPALTG